MKPGYSKLPERPLAIAINCVQETYNFIQLWFKYNDKGNLKA